jgi:tetratricopeptide (TPR) repeat protein
VKQSVADFLESIAAAPDPELDLARRTVEAAQSEDPELPDLIRACAIPRSFDASAIGVLRGAPDDVAGNAELARLLSGQTFVSARGPGSWVYHNNMRRPLLLDWQDEDNLPRYRELSSRLLEHYWQQHEEIVAASVDFSRAGRVIRRASADRYLQIASELEQSLLAPLLEALYHAAVLGVDEAYDKFVSAYERHEAAGRLGVCEAALAATREYLEDEQPGDESTAALARLEYWEGRLLLERRLYAEAEPVLRAAVEHAPDDASELRARSQVVTALFQLDRLPDSVAACEDYRAAARRSGNASEIYNSTYQLAAIRWTLEELETAVELFDEAALSARAEGNSGLEAYARLALAGVLDSLGRIGDAFAWTFRAFDLSRTDLLYDDALAMSIAERFSDLFGSSDIRSADTLYEEARALSPAADDSPAAREQRTRYVNTLRTSGQVRRARRVLDVTKERARDETAELLLEDALTEEARGSPAAAIDIYDRIIEAAGASPYTVAAAYSNRAQQASLRGEWQHAFDDLDAAAARWTEIGHDRLRALTQIWRASILRRSGAVSEAKEALAAAEQLPQPQSAGYLSDYHEARAGIREASAEWADATEDYRTACMLRAVAGDVAGAAQSASDAARVAARAASWSDAAEWADNATTLLRRAAEADAYEPDENAQEADDDNARGVASMFGASRDPVRARELFEAALARVPDHRWYALNLATACAASGEWSAAADALDKALGGAPDHLRDSDLLYRLAEYRMKRAADLEQRDELDAALAAYGRAGESMPEGTRDGRVLDLAKRLGEAYVRLDRLDLAREAFERGQRLSEQLESKPAASVFDRQLAIVAGAEGDAETAATLARASVEHAGTDRWSAFWALVQDASLAPASKREVLRRVLRDIAADLQNGGEMDRFESHLSVGRPPGWTVKESVTLYEPSGRANVIVTTEPVPPGTTTEDYADAAGRQLEESEQFPGYRELKREQTEVDGLPAVIRKFEWKPAESGAPFTQIQLYQVDGPRGLTATGTTTSESWDDLEPDLEQLLLSIAASR